MSVGAKTRNTIAWRREIELGLFNLGLTRADVAAAMKIEEAAAENDFRQLGGLSAFPLPDLSVPERREKNFRDALRKYTELHRVKKESADEIQDGLYDALGNYLGITRLRASAEGVSETIGRLMTPVAETKWRGYQLLLTAIFCMPTDPITERSIFEKYLSNLIDNAESNGTWPTRETFSKKMAEWAYHKFRPQFRPTLNETAVKMIGDALQTLLPKEEKVLRLRFGLSSSDLPIDRAHTLRQCGQQFNVTRERMRQVEAIALRKLRHPTQARTLRFWVTPPEETAMQWLRDNESYLRTQVPPEFKSMPFTTHPKVPHEILDISMEELEMSARCFVGLQSAGIGTMRNLVQTTESELLNVHKFCPKSLKELKKIVASFGLWFKTGSPE